MLRKALIYKTAITLWYSGHIFASVPFYLGSLIIKDEVLSYQINDVMRGRVGYMAWQLTSAYNIMSFNAIANCRWWFMIADVTVDIMKSQMPKAPCSITIEICSHINYRSTVCLISIHLPTTLNNGSRVTLIFANAPFSCPFASCNMTTKRYHVYIEYHIWTNP